MNWLDKLPGSQRSPHGLEWALWKRLPAVLVWGTMVPMAAAVLVWWGAAESGPDAAVDAGRLLMTYQLLGLVALHWTLVLTMAIGCVIVMLMKGPGYVADAFPAPERHPVADGSGLDDGGRNTARGASPGP